MKKFFYLLPFVIIFLFNSILAFPMDKEDVKEKLDIEKAAIKVIENSLNVKQSKRALEEAEKQYNNMELMRAEIKSMIFQSKVGSYELAKRYDLLPYQSKYLLDVNTNNNEVIIASNRLQAYEQYINLLKLQYTINLQLDLVSNLNNDYKNSQLKNKLGIISNNDLKLISINMEKAKLELQKYKRNFNTALISLNKAMGEPIDKIYLSFDDTNIIPTMEIKQLNEYVNSALINRAELKNAKENIELKIKEFEYDKVEHYFPTDEYNKETQYSIDELNNNYELLKIDIQSEINTGYKNLLTKLKSCESAQKQCEIAKYNYETAEKSYELSNITLYDLENAKISYTQSQINLKNAQLDLWLYEIKMDYATGIGPGLTN